MYFTVPGPVWILEKIILKFTLRVKFLVDMLFFPDSELRIQPSVSCLAGKNNNAEIFLYNFQIYRRYPRQSTKGY